MWTFIIERGLGIAGGALALAAQMSGYTNTAIALGLIGVALFFGLAPICHHCRQLHLSRKDAGSRTVEPWHLQVIGLAGVIAFAAIALGGVLWQASRTGPAAAAVSRPIASEIQPASPGPQVDKPTLSQGDRDRLSNVIFELAELVEKHAQPLVQNSKEALEFHRMQLQSKDSPETSQIKAMMSRLLAASRAFQGAFNQLIAKHNYYRQDIMKICGGDGTSIFESYTRAVLRYDELAGLADGSSKAKRDAILVLSNGDWWRAHIALDQWVRECSKKITETRTSLR